MVFLDRNSFKKMHRNLFLLNITVAISLLLSIFFYERLPEVLPILFIVFAALLLDSIRLYRLRNTVYHVDKDSIRITVFDRLSTIPTADIKHILLTEIYTYVKRVGWFPRATRYTLYHGNNLPLLLNGELTNEWGESLPDHLNLHMGVKMTYGNRPDWFSAVQTLCIILAFAVLFTLWQKGVLAHAFNNPAAAFRKLI